MKLELGLKSKIEKVQKYFTRRLYYRCNIPYENYENRLKNLKLESIEIRKKQFDIIMIYKLINGLVDNDYSSILNIKTNSSTRGNSQRTTIDNSRLEVRRNVLNNRVAKQWNRLDESIIKLTSLTAFKNKIKMIIKKYYIF